MPLKSEINASSKTVEIVDCCLNIINEISKFKEIFNHDGRMWEKVWTEVTRLVKGKFKSHKTYEEIFCKKDKSPKIKRKGKEVKKVNKKVELNKFDEKSPKAGNKIINPVRP
jgi:hypothetical protein